MPPFLHMQLSIVIDAVAVSRLPGFPLPAERRHEL